MHSWDPQASAMWRLQREQKEMAGMSRLLMIRKNSQLGVLHVQAGWVCVAMTVSPTNPMRPPEELDMQTVDMERWLPFQFLTSLLLVRRGWFANHALQRL